MFAPDSKFLVVEDSASMRALLLMILQQLGFKNVVAAANGVLAWEELQKGGHGFDAILCDWMMPEMNGLELLRKIRADEKLSKIPVVMLTAEVADEQRALAFDCGVDGFVGKPFNAAQIREVLTEVSKQKASAGANHNKAKALIIDDNQVDRELLSAMLTKSGFEVVALSSAVSCLETIAAEHPHLILLDNLMPDMGGNQALQLIRSKYSEVALPVIMVSSKSDGSDVVESLSFRANDYITKPIQFDVAAHRIQTQLTISRQAETLARGREMGVVHAMIEMYNHQINNPLAIAVLNLDLLKAKHPTDPEIPEIAAMHTRIAEVVKKTALVLKNKSAEYENYVKTFLATNLEPKNE